MVKIFLSFLTLSSLVPPGRYTLLAQAERRALEAQAKIAEEDGNLNTSDLSNSDWVKYHLRRLAAASSEDEFLARAKQCFTRRTNVTLNGIHVSRELYAQQWGAHLKPNGCGSILFQGEMETPDIKVPMMHVRLEFFINYIIIYILIL